MFKCLYCGRFTPLPTCEHCGRAFEIIDGVYQLTHDPSIELGDGPTYIGYDRIGSYYGGRSWIEPDECTTLIGAKLAELAARGTLLDLGCGLGSHTVPAAQHGCTVIAGDISNVMLKLLLQKAAHSEVDLSRAIACRMNALSIPLPDDSVDAAIANSVLHLISEPMVVLDEIHRVLKPGGKLALCCNSPGLYGHEWDKLNREHDTRVSDFHKRYWELLNARGVTRTALSWRFDQYAACEERFGNRAQIEIEFSARRTGTMADGFLYRMGGKGFSDQQGVPDDLHELVIAQVVREFVDSYGPDFASVPFTDITEGLALQMFEKCGSPGATHGRPVDQGRDAQTSD